MYYPGTPGSVSQSSSGSESNAGSQRNSFEQGNANWLSNYARNGAMQRPQSASDLYHHLQMGMMGMSTPNVTARMVGEAPIWSEGQIANRVNQNAAQGQRQLGAMQQQQAGRLASQGYGQNSPLAAMLTNRGQLMNLGAQQRNENDLRWNAAEGNAKQVYQEQATNAGNALEAAKANAQYAFQNQWKPWELATQQAGQQQNNLPAYLDVLSRLASPQAYSRSRSWQDSLALGDPQANAIGADAAYFS